MKIRKDYLPFGKPNFSDEEIAVVSAVMRSGWIGMGPETIAFEHELAGFLGVPHVVTVNSCTSALFLSLLIKDVGPGDEVICPSLTWCSTANAALYLGADVVFCDVDPETLCVTPETVRARLSKKTKAVMVVHMGGLAADIAGIREVLPADVAIIEDAAHAVGARYADGGMVGSSGNLTCFSFYANKNLSTGEGGAIAVCEPEAAERLASLRLHGLSNDAWERFNNPRAGLTLPLTDLGYKMNYTDLQAAIGRVQLKRQPEFASIRQGIANRYVERLSVEAPELSFQHMVTHQDHARHLFFILLPQKRCFSLSRNDMLAALRQRNIGASIHYAPLHHMSLYASVEATGLAHTEDVCARVLTFPISASMTTDDADDVVDQCIDILEQSRI